MQHLKIYLSHGQIQGLFGLPRVFMDFKLNYLGGLLILLFIC